MRYLTILITLALLAAFPAVTVTQAQDYEISTGLGDEVAVLDFGQTFLAGDLDLTMGIRYMATYHTSSTSGDYRAQDHYVGPYAQLTVLRLDRVSGYVGGALPWEVDTWSNLYAVGEAGVELELGPVAARVSWMWTKRDQILGGRQDMPFVSGVWRF